MIVLTRLFFKSVHKFQLTWKAFKHSCVYGHFWHDDDDDDDDDDDELKEEELEEEEEVQEEEQEEEEEPDPKFVIPHLKE